MEFALQIYLKDLRKNSFLKTEEERKLFKKVNKGDSRAKDSIVTSYLPLVVKIAGRFAHYGTPIVDLISDGNIGLMRAVEKFDCKISHQFGKYASWWIKWSIIRALINSSKTIQIPVYMAERVSRWKKVSSRLMNHLQRLPDRSEIAQELKVDDKRARWIESAIKNTYSIDDVYPNHENDSRELSENIPDNRAKMPEDEFVESCDKKELKRLLEIIDQREASVLKMRYGFDNYEPMTLREVSKKLSISREWVRKIERKALTRLNRLITHKKAV